MPNDGGDAPGLVSVKLGSEAGAAENSLLGLTYHKHLWMERGIKTLANVTRHDIAEFHLLAAQIPIRPQVTTHGLEDANQALLELKHCHVKGAKELLVK